MEELTFQGQRLHAYRSTAERTLFFIYSEVVDAFHLTSVSPTTMRRARGCKCGKEVPTDVLVELKRVGLVQQKATRCIMLSEQDVQSMLDYLRDKGHLSPTSSSTPSAPPPPPTPSSSSSPARNLDETEGENREEGQVEERGEEGMPAPAEVDLQPDGDSSPPPPPTETPAARPPAKKRRRRLTQYPDSQEVEDLDDFLKWLATPKTRQGRGLEKSTVDKTGQKLLRE